MQISHEISDMKREMHLFTSFWTRFPAPRVEPLRVSSTEFRLAPYALFLTPPSQIPAHQHLMHRTVALETGKMPRDMVFRTKVQISWVDSENSGQIVTFTVKFLPESSEVVVGITLESHHLAQETCAPGFRRLFQLLRLSPATTQPRGARNSARTNRFRSLSRTDSDCTREVSTFACDVSRLHHCAHQARSFRSHIMFWPRTVKVFPSKATELLQWVLSKPTSSPASLKFVQQS